MIGGEIRNIGSLLETRFAGAPSSGPDTATAPLGNTAITKSYSERSLGDCNPKGNQWPAISNMSHRLGGVVVL